MYNIAAKLLFLINKMEKLSRDALSVILNNFSTSEILLQCTLNKKFLDICRSEAFWRIHCEKYYGAGGSLIQPASYAIFDRCAELLKKEKKKVGLKHTRAKLVYTLILLL